MARSPKYGLSSRPVAEDAPSQAAYRAARTGGGEIHRTLQGGGVWRIATDIEDYALHVHEVMDGPRIVP